MKNLEKEMNRPDDILDGFAESLWKLGFPCRRGAENRVDIIPRQVVAAKKKDLPEVVSAKANNAHTRD